MSNRGTGSCSSDSGGGGSASLTTVASGRGGGGAFERISVDVLVQIIHLLSPRDAARLSLVSHYFRSLISSYNCLWLFFLHHPSRDTFDSDSVFFFETCLRSAYPIQTFSRELMSTELSFMRIYGQRSQVPGSVIIDGGSGYCKFGWSKYDSPSGRCATFLEFDNIESPMYTRLRHFFATIYSSKGVQSPMSISEPLILNDAVKRLLRYLKETSSHGLYADWAGDIIDRRSITGFIIHLGSSPISWCSKKQQTKHIEIDMHFVRDLVRRRQIRVSHIHSADQLADPLAKTLSKPAFQRNMRHSNTPPQVQLGLDIQLSLEISALESRIHGSGDGGVRDTKLALASKEWERGKKSEFILIWLLLVRV
ncbi:hypothetical protein K2173_015479 [Erythroxylum novogranatense]|uniref:F-box domain-containing protein n=1 Tax=Erythroxylum novogranatense TaxID=1862640 RepID=A0AAV8SRT4_9ROSI|nr:hypothetical protein K2173_015479 [Erythroxylum novogranatense]